MSGVDVAAIRAALKGATPAPWRADARFDYIDDAAGERVAYDIVSDAELVALLRNNIEALLAELERAQAASEGVDMLIAQAERRGAAEALRQVADASPFPLIATWQLHREAKTIEKGGTL